MKSSSKFFQGRMLLRLMLCFLLLGSTTIACRKEDDVQIDAPQGKAKEFELLSVKSYAQGERVELDLELDIETLRAFSYEEREETGELKFLNVGEKERMHIFLRKEGDDASLSMATLTWQGRGERGLFLKKIGVELASGYNMRPGEKWYVMGVLGGELDVQNKTVRFGGTAASISVDNKQVVDVPYTFAWKQLNITKQNEAGIGATTMQARGALLRLHFYSYLAEDYELSGLTSMSNAWRAQGSFSPFAVANDAQQAGKKAQWTAKTPEGSELHTQSYDFNNLSIAIPRGSKHTTDRTLYLWVMPTGDASVNRDSHIKLHLKKAGSTSTSELQTYSNVGHRALREGASYRLSNVLSGTLMISEIYYQFAPKGSNPENANDQQVYSIVELYNPTIGDIDLRDYALVRTAYDTNTFGYVSAGKLHTRDNLDLLQAGFFPLDAVTGDNPYRKGTTSKFPTTNNNIAYRGSWHKAIYGTPSLKLGAGKTILIGAGGYVNTDHKPGKNIELFNDAGKPATTRAVEKLYLPRAGMQADSAHRAGYLQFMIAINNSDVNTADPNPSSKAGVLQLGNAQGVALVKAESNAAGTYDYRVVDISTPIGQDAARNAEFLNKLSAAGQSQDYTQAMSYSIVRDKGLMAKPEYQAKEWSIALTENDGVKSLGTRDYVAGLSPYEGQYTAYNTSNNPKGNPFWGNTVAPAFGGKAWSKLPDAGTNTFPAATGADPNDAAAAAQLFTDVACTELKSGLTYEQIMNSPNQFYREIARKMLQGTYQREFRIQDYRAWTNPAYQQKLNKNQFPYGSMDNPTGMYFAEGEEITVLVNDTKGHNLSLIVVNPRHAQGYRGRVTYALQKGVNKLRMTAPGHGYLVYQVDELDVNRTLHPDIRVHFAEGSGVVNGYYDAYKAEHRGRWSELLGKAKAEHFDVLGQHAQLLLRTDAFRKVVSDPKPLLDTYDKIVYQEMSMMGLLLNNKARMYRNRLPYTRWYGGFLYAHFGHTAYAGDNVDYTKIPFGSWGLAHETGHMNQTLGFNWGGLAEISNNLHSFYIEHVVFGGTSRLQRSAEDQYGKKNDEFTKAWNNLLETPNRPVTSESRGSNSLVPFVQLHLYFGMIKGKTPSESNGHDGFLPQLYENLRNANYSNYSNIGNANHNGYQQLEFTYHASKAAGYDLTEFFDRWGFYRVANNLVHYNTYWDEFKITVTQAQIEGVKQRIKALNLPKPDNFALEYITVLNRELYRTYKPVVRGTVVKNNQTFTLAGWKNVAAWEIRDANGKLLYTETGGSVPQDATYTVTYPSILTVTDAGTKNGKSLTHRVYTYPSWDDSYKLYAIDARGIKTLAN